MKSLSPPTGKVTVRLRLNRFFRFAVYTAFATLFVTGAAWLWADAMKDSTDGELWQARAANLLMVHGGAAMVALLFLGALFPLHVQRAWRARKNRMTGIVMGAAALVLIVTSFGLYYSASDTIRSWTSDVHIGFGLAWPALLVCHIWRGRRLRAT